MDSTDALKRTQTTRSDPSITAPWPVQTLLFMPVVNPLKVYSVFVLPGVYRGFEVPSSKQNLNAFVCRILSSI